MAGRKKPTVELRRPPRADRARADSFVQSGEADAPRGKREVLERADGTAVRRQTVYLPPELDRKIRLYGVEHDLNISETIVLACKQFFGEG